MPHHCYMYHNKTHHYLHPGTRSEVSKEAAARLGSSISRFQPLPVLDTTTNPAIDWGRHLFLVQVCMLFLERRFLIDFKNISVMF